MPLRVLPADYTNCPRPYDDQSAAGREARKRPCGTTEERDHHEHPGARLRRRTRTRSVESLLPPDVGAGRRRRALPPAADGVARTRPLAAGPPGTRRAVADRGARPSL